MSVFAFGSVWRAMVLVPRSVARGLDPVQEPTANLVHSVLTYGLCLKERLVQGEKADLSTEQNALKERLGGHGHGRGGPDWGGDSVNSMGSGVYRPGGSGRRGTDGFLGIRYALTCWLDEI